MKLTSDSKYWNADRNKFVPGRVTTCYDGQRWQLEMRHGKERTDLMFALEHVMLDMLKMTKQENHGVESYTLSVECNSEIDYLFCTGNILHLSHSIYRGIDCEVDMSYSDPDKNLPGDSAYCVCFDGYHTVEIIATYKALTIQEKMKNDVIGTTRKAAVIAAA